MEVLPGGRLRFRDPQGGTHYDGRFAPPRLDFERRHFPVRELMRENLRVPQNDPPSPSGTCGGSGGRTPPPASRCATGDAEGGTRTHTGLPPEVFETSASTIPPPRPDHLALKHAALQ
jgi:hypothetical protein